MAYSKPQVTIDLEEYKALKAVDVQIYKESINIILKHVSADRNMPLIKSMTDDLKKNNIALSSDESHLFTVKKI